MHGFLRLFIRLDRWKTRHGATGPVAFEVRRYRSCTRSPIRRGRPDTSVCAHRMYLPGTGRQFTFCSPRNRTRLAAGGRHVFCMRHTLHAETTCTCCGTRVWTTVRSTENSANTVRIPVITGFSSLRHFISVCSTRVAEHDAAQQPWQHVLSVRIGTAQENTIIEGISMFENALTIFSMCYLTRAVYPLPIQRSIIEWL